ncbi:glycosyltransferase [Brachyspira catarrhinii]|uniref:Glycosyl transferase family 8 n=1 Tax=Brachyspira catarrhinii TaxID=2528966 RepID=A0ABY2TPG9_9SPIR|nr:glycosyltransferase [Brachyspira catarrhinii]TKZ32537.1 glycosyl transferase family 8 [Brachyspira catarrhinii]
MKKFALLLCSTENQMFAVGNVLIGFKKYFSLDEKDYDIIVLVDTINDKNRSALEKIHKNIIIKKFENPFSKSFLNSVPGSNWSFMAFARFEAFELIKDYEKLLYVDTDTLIKKDLSSILSFNEKSIYMAYDILNNQLDYFVNNGGSNFVEKYKDDKYDLNRKIFNSGIMILTNKLHNGSKIKKWCYEYCEKIVGTDLFVINLAIQEFNLDIGVLDNIYNYTGDYNHLDNVYIIHALGKFWESSPYYEWDENNKKWIEFGGEEYNSLYIKQKKEMWNKILWWIPSRRLRERLRIKIGKKYGFMWRI